MDSLLERFAGETHGQPTGEVCRRTSWAAYWRGLQENPMGSLLERFAGESLAWEKGGDGAACVLNRFPIIKMRIPVSLSGSHYIE